MRSFFLCMMRKLQTHDSQVEPGYQTPLQRCCRYSMSTLTGEPRLTAAELEGPWAMTSHAAFELDDENGFRDSSTAAPARCVRVRCSTARIWQLHLMWRWRLLAQKRLAVRPKNSSAPEPLQGRLEA